MEKVYIVWIWWIWISAIARYYNQNWYKVFGSDKTNSELIEKLKLEWIDIIIWEDEKRITEDFSKVVYTEAVKLSQKEIEKAIKFNIKINTYPQEVAEISNTKKIIAISWTHWKSTTTSLTSLIFKNSDENFTSIVWTVLKEFDGKNFYSRNNWDKNNEYFILEACEYKRSFLNYKPTVAVITNIELDHIDYYKDLEDYISAYDELINNVVSWGYVILNWNEENSKSLIWKRKDINYIEIKNDKFIHNWEEFNIPEIELKIPWEHILFDAKIAYIVWIMAWIDSERIIKSLSLYNWIWRRMETVGKTNWWNTLMSDYWHHPTEIKLTLETLKDSGKYNSILTIFQPHQYSRTYELLNDFKESFKNTDELIIPNIYESRDSLEDKKRINTQLLVDKIIHDNKTNWENMENTLNLINNFDKENTNSLIILMWAWDVDNLRQKIKTT